MTQGSERLWSSFRRAPAELACGGTNDDHPGGLTVMGIRPERAGA